MLGGVASPICARCAAVLVGLAGAQPQSSHYVLSAVCPQEVGDKNQLVARLAEQIAEAEAAHQAAKQQRNAAQDQRKDAWRKEQELKEQIKTTEAEFTKAFNVSACRRQLCQTATQCAVLRCAVRLGLCRDAAA